jgi:hypothetical protein
LSRNQVQTLPRCGSIHLTVTGAAPNFGYGWEF